jgi:RNA polymerase sigma-70 factor (ECF subfamily)
MDPDLDLIRRLREGDTAAFDEVFSAMNPRLLSFLYRMSGNRATVEDLVEETWLRLACSAAALRPDTRLVPWLFTVARNLYLSYCRSRVREPAYTSDLILLWPEEACRSPFELASGNEFERRLEAALAGLPPLYREVILLVAVEGLRPTDAAAVCGIRPEALRQRLSRARAMLASRLEITEVAL